MISFIFKDIIIVNLKHIQGYFLFMSKKEFFNILPCINSSVT